MVTKYAYHSMRNHFTLAVGHQVRMRSRWGLPGPRPSSEGESNEFLEGFAQVDIHSDSVRKETAGCSPEQGLLKHSSRRKSHCGVWGNGYHVGMQNAESGRPSIC
jgi:hypothetical protein